MSLDPLNYALQYLRSYRHVWFCQQITTNFTKSLKIIVLSFVGRHKIYKSENYYKKKRSIQKSCEASIISKIFIWGVHGDLQASIEYLLRIVVTWYQPVRKWRCCSLQSAEAVKFRCIRGLLNAMEMVFPSHVFCSISFNHVYVLPEISCHTQTHVGSQRDGWLINSYHFYNVFVGWVTCMGALQANPPGLFLS